MRKIFIAVAALVLYIFPAHADINSQFIDAAGKIKPSVVNIIIFKIHEKNGRKVYTKTGYGSGTIISADGHLVTNYHVVIKGNYYQILLSDGTECEAEKFSNGGFYLGDQKTDLAVLKISGPEGRKLTPVVFGDSESLKEGEWVMAVGNPFGLKQSITCGIVSSKGRNNIGFTDIEDFIQTDVSINPGNSGGPLVNLRGEVVGINTAIRTLSGGFQGISFSIPSSIVKQVSYELIRYGKVRRGWLGFLARESRIYRKGEKSILEVISVMKNSPAEMAGICKGDIIREVDGRKLYSLGELVNTVGNKPLGSRIKITVSREGYLYHYQLVLREKEEYQKYGEETRRLLSRYGFELSENSATGEIVVSYLSPMGPAYQYGLQKGDIIESINGEAVSTIKNFMDVYYKDRFQILKMEIARGSRLYTIGFPQDLQ